MTEFVIKIRKMYKSQIKVYNTSTSEVLKEFRLKIRKRYKSKIKIYRTREVWTKFRPKIVKINKSHNEVSVNIIINRFL